MKPRKLPRAAEMEQFDKVRATYTPQRTDDLKPGVEEWIGYEAEWTAMYVLEDEDSAAYAGQLAWMVTDPYLPMPPFAWVPSCDLTPIERNR